MKNILFVLGFFCWVDWLPYLDPSLIEIFNFIIIIIFLIILVFNNIKYLFPLNKLNIILLIYLVYVTPSTLANYDVSNLSIIQNILIIILILSKSLSDTKSLVNGFVFGGFLTSLYMFLMIFDVIIINDLSILDKFEFGDWFINDRESLISIGFTNKYNKLSYLFSFLICILFTRVNLKTFYKLILTFLIIYLQIKTTGRGGLIISILFMGYLAFRSKKWYLIAPAVFIFIYSTLNSVIFQDIGGRFDLENASYLARLFQYSYVIENFTDNLIFGIGYVSTIDLVGATYVHNFFLNNLLKGGVIGFCLSLIIISTLIRTVANSKMNKDLKVFIVILIIMQSIFENFNLILALGSYILIWIFISEIRQENISEIKIDKKHLINYE